MVGLLLLVSQFRPLIDPNQSVGVFFDSTKNKNLERGSALKKIENVYPE
jgi:hypothetical protein